MKIRIFAPSYTKEAPTMGKEQKEWLQITFQINYRTQWGERVVVTGNIPELGNNDWSKGINLKALAAGDWMGGILLAPGKHQFSYQYAILNDQNQIMALEWGTPREAKVHLKKSATIAYRDAWKAKQHPENGLYNSAFLDVIFKPGQYKPAKLKRGKSTLTFQMAMPRLNTHQQLCLLGNTPELGNWDLSQPVLMGNAQAPIWSVSVPTPDQSRLEYKYGIYDSTIGQVLHLEAGDNRVMDARYFHGFDQTCISDHYFKHPQGNWKGAGMAIPVFALRSDNGFGVGSFTDIQLLVDWAKSCGMSMVQILPVNDTSATGTWVDSYPYAAISVFALHPILLDLTVIPGFTQYIDQQKYQRDQQTLNALPQVDYEQVMKLKLDYARQIYDNTYSDFLAGKAFQSFLEENKHWLKPYAYFCTLRDAHKTVDFQKWGPDSVYDKKRMKKATSSKGTLFNEIAFYYFLQYHLDQQLAGATAYARSQNIVLKGDIPIGIYRYSVDAWVAPELYNMDGQSGAPPDPFSDLGQNWGFPTYNWKVMAQDDYAWWQNRLKQLSGYFDAFRIDHILGFFRIWQIPVDQVEGTMGFFNPAIPVYVDEFGRRGIAFDRDRYCKPYITDWVLDRLFGTDADWVREHLLTGEGNYQLKSGFNTQRKIEAFFEKQPSHEKAALKTVLYKLVSNVLFFEVPGSNGTQFHPRIDLLQTTSFEGLDMGAKVQLTELYNDYFYQRQNTFWKQQAMSKLPAIKAATNMLICGEDLGMIPDSVPEVMRDLELLTLEIQRMSKNPATEFLQAADIPYLSVISPSTHDMSPIRAWWAESDRSQIQRFFSQELGQGGGAPADCSPYLAEQIIWKHLWWPGMWTVFPIQDLLAMDGDLRLDDPEKERINVPANPKHYWRYRLHQSLETLIASQDFNRKLQSMLKRTGRAAT